jgi:hypothetical protein
MATDNFCFYLQNRLIQTSHKGGQWYNDTSPLVFPGSTNRPLDTCLSFQPSIIHESKVMNVRFSDLTVKYYSKLKIFSSNKRSSLFLNEDEAKFNSIDTRLSLRKRDVFENRFNLVRLSSPFFRFRVRRRRRRRFPIPPFLLFEALLSFHLRFSLLEEFQNWFQLFVVIRRRRTINGGVKTFFHRR